MAGHQEAVVVDSSVAVKWFSSEEDTNKALRLRDDHLRGARALHVCDLLYHEVANALRFNRSYDESKLSEAVNSLFSFHLNTWPSDARLLGRAASIAYTGGVTIYDAVPVALASINGTVCITADEETQYKKLKTRGQPVSLLSREAL